jgi:hypothetical protein
MASSRGAAVGGIGGSGRLSSEDDLIGLSAAGLANSCSGFRVENSSKATI